MRKVFHYLAPYKWRLISGLTIKITGTLLDLGLPYILAFIIDDVIPMGQWSYIAAWGVVMLAMSFLSRFLNVSANRRASRVSRDVIEEMRRDLFHKVQHLSGTGVDVFTIPSLISRLTSDTYNIHSMISMMQRMGVRAPILMLGGIAMTFTLEPVLTLVLVGSLPLLVLIVVRVSKVGIPLFRKVQRSQDRMVRVVRENIGGIRVIKALSKTRYEKGRFGGANHELVEMEVKAGMTMAATGPLISFLLNVGLTLVIIVGAYRVNAGQSEPGKIVAFLNYFLMMLHAVMAVNRMFVMYSRASASAARIEEVLDSEEDLVVRKEEDGDGGSADDAHIVFEDVTFSYPVNLTDGKMGGEAKDVPNGEMRDKGKDAPNEAMGDKGKDAPDEKESLTDISLSIKKGESLGVIGSTGSGKTTLVSLLMRFYDVTKGSVRIDGRDVRTIPMEELRGRFGVVFQNDVIFADTLYENVSFGRRLDEKWVEEAGRHAQADEFIRGKEGGYGFQASIKGANLSGGQKQRLLVARALAGKPEILILDDSSSALDYKTDAELRKAIRENYKETTTIWIAQRVSSVHQCDHILVLEDGRTIGYGKHDDLLENCSVYQEIYQSQMKE